MVFILDKSGSMSGLEADTIGGFNGMIEKQKKEEGEALVSTVLFSDESMVSRRFSGSISAISAQSRSRTARRIQ